jgi:hypothetical protein
MKTLITLALLSVAAGASARSPEMDRNLDTRDARMEREKASVAQPGKNRNKIVGRRATYSGIVVQTIKAENPLQLLNPAAPEEYWNGKDSVIHEPNTERVNGLKLFSIEF